MDDIDGYSLYTADSDGVIFVHCNRCGQDFDDGEAPTLIRLVRGARQHSQECVG